MTTRKLQILLISGFGSLLFGLSGWLIYNSFRLATHFDGQRAYQDVRAQLSFGARTPGSIAHGETITYIQQVLEKADWKVQIQSTEWDGFPIKNIVASRSDVPPRIIVGAHYDSRLLADQDLGSESSRPVPGANDGASGVAVLLELARSLPSDSVPVWLVFFDAEDNGGLDNRQWIMGSRAFVSTLSERPQSVVIVDMVGDADLKLFIERNSDATLTAKIWSQAAELGYGNYFIATPKYNMLDDHTSFLEAGIPAVDIIDFDYPYWHTSADTADKISAHSLQAVGETLWAWIESQN
jgi:glutaminyl-peptide cyclotransferase